MWSYPRSTTNNSLAAPPSPLLPGSNVILTHEPSQVLTCTAADSERQLSPPYSQGFMSETRQRWPAPTVSLAQVPLLYDNNAPPQTWQLQHQHWHTSLPAALPLCYVLATDLFFPLLAAQLCPKPRFLVTAVPAVDSPTAIACQLARLSTRVSASPVLCLTYPVCYNLCCGCRSTASGFPSRGNAADSSVSLEQPGGSTTFSVAVTPSVLPLHAPESPLTSQQQRLACPKSWLPLTCCWQSTSFQAASPNLVGAVHLPRLAPPCCLNTSSIAAVALWLWVPASYARLQSTDAQVS